MIRNYFITAVRNLWRQRGSTVVNIAGLSIGIAGSLILFLLVYYHSHFDTFQSKKERVFRVVVQSKGNTGNEYTGGIPAPLPEAFESDFPQAEEVVFVSYRSGALITITQGSEEPKKYNEESGVVFTQPQFFRVFDRKSIVGDPQQGLDEPNEAVISESLAKKYFGSKDPIGLTVRHDSRDYQISAVVEDPSDNTDFPFTLFLSHATIKKQTDEQGWNSIWSDEHCYFLLKEGESLRSIEAGLPAFAKKYLKGDDANRQVFLLQPLTEVHSDDRFGNFNYNTVSKASLYFLSAIAIVLILTACINFVNLSTAEAVRRAREVGVRKALGSSRSQLIRQFLGETTLLTFIAVIFAVALAYAGLTFLNPFLGLKLLLTRTTGSDLWLYLLGVTVCVSLLSGLYPSFVMSAFKPALAMKSALQGQTSGYGMRRVLVVAQFFISQVLIIATIVILRQMDYLANKDLGYNKNAVVNIAIPQREEPGAGESKMRTLREQVSALSGVMNASLNNSAPSSSNVQGTNFKVQGKDEDFGTQVKQVDGNYVDLFELNLIEGEGIGDYDTARGFIVNEKLYETVGMTSPNEIIGKEIRMWGKNLPVVGVVKNFNTVSLAQAIEPVVILNRLRGFSNLSVKLNPSTMQATLPQIQKLWEQSYPEAIFSYEFLDEQVRNFYESERKMSVLLSIFTSMAIFIGCLGLYGLVTFMANQRNKEIGIRKVLGASVSGIILIFSREFVILILIGFALAAPAAWFGMQNFLNEFAFKAPIDVTVFLVGVAATIAIAMLTVGYRSFKAATANPVDSLRSE